MDIRLVARVPLSPSATTAAMPNPNGAEQLTPIYEQLNSELTARLVWSLALRNKKRAATKDQFAFLARKDKPPAI